MILIMMVMIMEIMIIKQEAHVFDLGYDDHDSECISWEGDFESQFVIIIGITT